MPQILPNIHEAEYFISIRFGWLPLRLGERIVLEACNPHRFAHQFGFDQVVPSSEHPSSSLQSDMKSISDCWFSMIRLKTGSSCKIPRATRLVQFSASYQKWFNAMTAAYHSQSPEEITTIINNRTRLG